MLVNKRAYSFVEMMVVLVIISLTATIALTLISPRSQSAHDAALTHLEQLKNAIIVYNAAHPGNEFDQENTDGAAGPLWWTFLPSINNPDLTDPYDSYYEHDYYRGCVFSKGPNQRNDGCSGDDIVVYYRPPSAEIVERIPSPNSTTNTADPYVFTRWRLGQGMNITSAKIYMDKRLITETPSTLSNVPGTRHTTGLVGHTVTGLSDGIHFAQVLITDSQSNSRRISWNFRVDTRKPQVYSLNPVPLSTFEYLNPIISCQYNDASGIDLTKFKLWIRPSTATYTGWPAGDLFDYNRLKQGAGPSGNYQWTCNLGTSGFVWRPPIEGLQSDDYEVEVEVWDMAGNKADPVIWKFSITDNTAPQIQIQQPAYGTALTTDCDIDGDYSNGCQIAVVGTAEPGCNLELNVEHHGAVVYTDNSLVSSTDGSFRYDLSNGHAVPIYDSFGGSNIPSNTIRITCKDSAGNEGKASTLVQLFNSENRLHAGVEATPLTTKPNKDIEFSVWAYQGTTPYTFIWDFDDGYTREGVMTSEYATCSLRHTFTQTGNFSVTCKITDELGLTAAATQVVYVGTEAEAPSLFLKAVPLEVFAGIAGSKTNFQIRIGGKYLGNWRLHVENNKETDPRNFFWYYSTKPAGTDFAGTYRTADLVGHATPHDTNEWLWQSASSNDFLIPWDGTDNFMDSTFYTNASLPLDQRKFPSNKMCADPSITPNSEHYVFLEYIDALGDMVTTSAEVRVYSSIPSPEGIHVCSVNKIPNSPQLFDKDLDGYPDYTNSDKVDIAITTPSSTNPTDYWLSNFPVELHLIVPPASALVNSGEAMCTHFQREVDPTAEQFWNWSTGQGHCLDGSSGWLPLDPAAIALGINGVTYSYDWPLTAWPSTYIQGNFSNQSDTDLYSAPWFYPTSVWEALPLGSGSIWGTPTLGGRKPGMELDHDGERTIYCIFRDADVFVSTMYENSTKCSDGVTAATIVLDMTPPVPVSRPVIKDVQIVGDWSDPASLSVRGTIAVTAEDISYNGYYNFEGSGLIPNGMVLLQTPSRQTQMAYQSEIEFDFGDLFRWDPAANGGTGAFVSNLDSVAPNSILSAVVSYRDNLGSLSIPSGSIGGMDVASAQISQFTWTVVGSGDYHYFDADSGESSPYGIVSDQGTATGGNVLVWMNAVDPSDTHWLSNGANLGTWIYEDKVAIADTNISADHFPDPVSRMGRLVARWPNGSAIDQTATFICDDQHYYYLIMMKGGTYVEYRLYQSDHDDTVKNNIVTLANQSPPTDPQGGIAARYIVEHPAEFEFVCSVDKVSRQGFIPARVNDGILFIPIETGSGSESTSDPTASNYRSQTRDLHDMPNTLPPNADFNKYVRWDEVIDLLITDAVSATNWETYTFKGVLSDWAGGVIHDVFYKVTSNTFSVKTGFVDIGNPSAPITSNTYVGTDIDYHRKLVKAELVSYTAGGANGFDIDINNTQIVDVVQSGYDPLPPGQISGNDFSIRFSNYSNDFSWMTTGSIRPCVFLEFYPSGGGSTKRARMVTDSGPPDSSWNWSQPATAELFLPPIVDRRGNPNDLRFNDTSSGTPVIKPIPTIEWNALVEDDFGNPLPQEGEVKAFVYYLDAQNHMLSAFVTTATVDSKPPSGPGGADPVIVCWGYPGVRDWHYNDPNSSTFFRSAAPDTWTSASSFTVDYRNIVDTDTFYREFVAIDPNVAGNVDLFGSYLAAPDLSGAPGDIYGDSTNDGTSPSPRWYAVQRTTPETMDFTNSPGLQGPNNFYFRFKDNAHNIMPPITPTLDGGMDNDGDNEAELISTLARDEYGPNAPAGLTITTRTVGCWCRNHSTNGAFFINDNEPNFTFTITEPSAGGLTNNSGIIGANVAIDQTGAATNPPDFYPPMLTVPAAPELSYTFTACATDTSALQVFGDGPKTLAIEGIDLVGNVGANGGGTFYFDSTGPDILTSQMAFYYREFAAGNVIAQVTCSNTAWQDAPLLSFPTQLPKGVEQIIFSCTSGKVTIDNVWLADQFGTKTSPASFYHPYLTTDTFRYPASGTHLTNNDQDNWDFDLGDGNDMYCLTAFHFNNDYSQDKKRYTIDDLWGRFDGSDVGPVIVTDGYPLSPYVKSGTSPVTTNGFEIFRCNGYRLDFQDPDTSQGSAFWHEVEAGRMTLHAGESVAISVNPTDTLAKQLHWQHINRSNSVRREYISTDTPSAINDYSSTYSTINVPDHITIQEIRVKMDITHTYIGDLYLTLHGPPSTSLQGYLHYHSGGDTDDIKGTYGDDLTPYTDGMLTKKEGDDAFGNWTLTVHDSYSNDTGTLTSWTLIVIGDDGTTPNAQYTVQVAGPGDWLGTNGPFTSFPQNLVSSATQVECWWNQVGTSAEDPGFGDAPPTGIGVSANDPLGIVPDEWEFSSNLVGESPSWVATDEPRVQFSPVQGNTEFKIRARDLLGNPGPPLVCLTVLSDAFPPQTGALTAWYGDGGGSLIQVGSEAVHPGHIPTNVVEYHLAVSDAESGVNGFCYTISQGSGVDPDPGSDPVHELGYVEYGGTIVITVSDTGVPQTPALQQGQDIYFRVLVRDKGGTWSENYAEYIIPWVDWTDPGQTLAAISDGNSDNAHFPGIQMNGLTHFINGAGHYFQLSGTGTDGGTGRSGVYTIEVSLDGGGSWNNVYTAAGTGTSSHGWSWNWNDPGENDPGNVNGGVQHDIALRVTDWCGNVSEVNPMQTVYVDTTAPGTPGSINVAAKAAEPDILNGSKNENNSYVCVYTTNSPPAACDAGVAGGLFVAGTGIGSYDIGNSPMDNSGYIHVYEKDGAGNYSATPKDIYLNNPPTVNSITVANSSGDLVLTVNITDPDEPDRLAAANVRITTMEWRCDDEDYDSNWHPIDNNDLSDPAAVSFPYTGATPLAGGGTDWNLTWDSDAHSPPTGINALKDTAATNGLSIRIEVTDTKDTVSDIVSGSSYDVDNNENPTFASATRTPNDAVVRGDIDIDFNVSDTDLVGTPWDELFVKLQYSTDNGGSWSNVPDASVTPNMWGGIQSSGAQATRTWHSTNEFPNQIVNPIRLRLRVQDRQAEDLNITIPVGAGTDFELRNLNNAPDLTIDGSSFSALINSSPESFDITVDDPDSGLPSENIDITNVEFDNDGSGAFLPATISGYSEGPNNISLNTPYPAPKTVTINWNVQADLDGIYSTTARVRVTIADSLPASVSQTQTGLSIDLNDIPSISAPAPGGVSGTLPIAWTIAGDNSDHGGGELWDVQVQYRGTDQASWVQDTVQTGVNNNTGTYNFDSTQAVDSGNVGTADLQIRVRDDSGEPGQWTWVSVFSGKSIDNNDDPDFSSVSWPSDDSGDIDVDFTIDDNDNGQTWTVELEYRYQTWDGSSWSATSSWADAVTASANYSNKTDTHVFHSDDNSLSTHENYTKVKLRMRVEDNVQSNFCTWNVQSGTFIVDNNNDPTIASNAPLPSNGDGGNCGIGWTVTDTESQNYEVEFKWDNGGSSNSYQIQASGGKSATYNWNSKEAYPDGTSGNVTLQFRVRDDVEYSWSSWMGDHTFHVDNDP